MLKTSRERADGHFMWPFTRSSEIHAGEASEAKATASRGTNPSPLRNKVRKLRRRHQAGRLDDVQLTAKIADLLGVSNRDF